MKMKVKVVMAVFIVGMLCMGGCTNNQKEKNNKVEENEEKYEMQVYRTPTEEEMEILEDCNLSREQLEKIKKEGMDISTQSFVDTAQIMLDNLEEKYGEEFEIEGGEIPGIISGEYMIFAHAVDGENQGERFEVYYLVDEDGNAYCEDGYFAILKRMEVQEYLQNIAQEAGTDIKVVVSLEGKVGEKYNKDTTIEEIKNLNKNKGLQIFAHSYVRPEMSDEEFQKQVQKLEEDLKQTDLYIKYTVFRLIYNEKFDYIQEYSDIGIVFSQETSSEENYNLRYHAYIKPNQ